VLVAAGDGAAAKTAALLVEATALAGGDGANDAATVAAWPKSLSALVGAMRGGVSLSVCSS